MKKPLKDYQEVVMQSLNKRIQKKKDGLFRRFWLWSFQNITIVLIPDSKHQQICMVFKPIIPLSALTIIVAVVVLGLFSAFKQGKTEVALAATVGELEDTSRDLDSIRFQVDKMLNVMDDLHEALKGLREQKKSQFSGVNPESGDFSNLSEGRILTRQDRISDSEILAALNNSISDSIDPLRETINLVKNQKDLLTVIPTLWPVQGKRGYPTMHFGPNRHPMYYQWYLHRGLDIAAHPVGAPIIATASGKVIDIGYKPAGYGHYVHIQHKYGIYTFYGHLQRTTVEIGQSVAQGEVIGLMGSSGNTTGTHVHYEVRIGAQYVDPVKFLLMSSNGEIIDSIINKTKNRTIGGSTVTSGFMR